MNRAAKLIVVFIVTLGLFYMACVHFTDNYHIAVTWNRFTGEFTCDTAGGFHFTAPWVKVARIDTRPVRMCITSAGRGFNCKLVQFQPERWRTFVETEGFQYWWWANRLSFNGGYDDEYRGMKDLLRGYAYGIKQYPFVKTLRDYSTTEP